MLPIKLLTFNLATWIINIGLIYLWSLLSVNVSFSSWEFAGFSFGNISVSAYDFVWVQTFLISAVTIVTVMSFLEWLLK